MVTIWFWLIRVMIALLIALLIWWRARAGTVSLRMIDSVSREAFFWAAALAAYALGTAIVHLSGWSRPAWQACGRGWR
jgi:uncharacterized membrane-anchored protein